MLANGLPINAYVMTQNFTAWDWLITDGPHYFGLIPGWANPTGMVLLVILCIIYVASMKWVRKGGYFEVIWLFYFFFGGHFLKKKALHTFKCIQYAEATFAGSVYVLYYRRYLQKLLLHTTVRNLGIA